jgi:hypothetical protein
MNKEPRNDNNETQGIPLPNRETILLTAAMFDVPHTEKSDEHYLSHTLAFMKENYPGVVQRAVDISTVMCDIYPPLPGNRFSNEMRAYQNTYITGFALLCQLYHDADRKLPKDIALDELQPWYRHECFNEQVAPNDVIGETYAVNVAKELDYSNYTFYREQTDFCDAMDVWAAHRIPTMNESRSVRFAVMAAESEVFRTMEDLENFNLNERYL